MATMQPEVSTRAEPLTVGFTFVSRDYTLDNLTDRLEGLRSLVLVAIGTDGSVNEDSPQFRVQRVNLASPLEVWVGITFASASAGILLANRLVNLGRNMSTLRVNLKQDRFEAEKWSLAYRLVRGLPNADEAPETAISRAARVMADLEVLAIEGTGDAETEVVVMDSPSERNEGRTPTDTLSRSERELRELARRILRELGDG